MSARQRADRGPASQPALLYTRNTPVRSTDVAGGEPTYVVVGSSRSGTTMTAGVLQILGVEFGDGTAHRGEDLEINDCVLRLQKGAWPLRLWGVRRDFGRLVTARRARWGLFGFKTPHLGQALPVLADKIPNAVYVFVLRNPLKSAVSWERTHDLDVWKTLPGVLVTQLVTAWFMARTRRPVVMFAYEDAARDPARFIEELVPAAGLCATPETMATAADFIDPARGYRDTRRVFGRVDRLTETRVSGWICDLADPNASIEVELLLGDTVVASGTAGVQRRDVKRAGHHASGHCGFDFVFSEPLTPCEKRPLKLRVPASRREMLIEKRGVLQSAVAGAAQPSNDAAPRMRDTTSKA